MSFNKRKMHISALFLYFVLVMFAVFQVYPVIWVILSSIKTDQELILNASYSLPSSFYFGNYLKALESSNIPRAFINSIIVAICTLTLEVCLDCPAAFAITKLRFKHGKKLLSFFLMGMMIPTFVCLIPMFKVYNTVGLRNSYMALILPQVGFGLPIGIYMYTSFMSFLPDSLLEAASIDGAAPFQVFTRIVIPMVKNTTITIITFKFIYVWNEFTYANTFMTEKAMKTLPITLKDFAGENGMVEWGPTYAAITMAILPTLILYFLLSKNVIEGMALGAVKS